MRNPVNPDTGLTTRQQEVWRYLAQHLREHQYPASLREIGQALGISSPNAVHDHLVALENKSMLILSDHRARSHRLAGVRLELIPDAGPAGDLARRLLLPDGTYCPPVPTLDQAKRALRAAAALVRAIQEGKIPLCLAELKSSVHALEGGER